MRDKHAYARTHAHRLGVVDVKKLSRCAVSKFRGGLVTTSEQWLFTWLPGSPVSEGDVGVVSEGVVRGGLAVSDVSPVVSCQ